MRSAFTDGVRAPGLDPRDVGVGDARRREVALGQPLLAPEPPEPSLRPSPSRGSGGPATSGSCLSCRASVNPAMSSDDRIDNKRNLVSSASAVGVQNREGGARDVVPLDARPARARGGRVRRRGRAGSAAAPGARRASRAARAGADPAPPAPLLSCVDACTVLRLASRCGAGSGSCASSSTSSSPGPRRRVVDVGVTDAPFGGGSSDNFFEALYPWPERITGGRPHRARPLRRPRSRP